MNQSLLKNSSFIGGQWISGGVTNKVRNPATGELLSEISCVGKSEAIHAIEAAEQAFSIWRKRTASDKSSKLRALFNIIQQRKKELAQILSSEQGKPLSEAEREISYGASYIEWYAEEAKRIYGQLLPANSTAKTIITTREPIGVCAAITPWNFPMAMIARKMAPALAAGCSFIVKPALETPLSALALAACVEEAGFPAGVFNVVVGDAEPIAEALMESEKVRKLSFTGSTEVGKRLYAQAATTLKKLTLELGGNAPFIIFEDADLDTALADALFAKYRNAGQTCICANRFLVARSVSKKFCAMLVEASKKLKVGPGLTPGNDIGPLINTKAKEKITRLLTEAVHAGATLELGSAESAKDLFFSPCVLSGVTQKMAIAREEIFGPVAAIQEFDTEEEAIAIANDTNYGLAAYLYTQNIARAQRSAAALQYGMIGINNSVISLVEAPFGGIKHSGFGREGGHEGIEEYLNLKYMCVNG